MEQSTNIKIRKQIKIRKHRYTIKGTFNIKYFYITEYYDTRKNKTWYCIIYLQKEKIIFNPKMFISFYKALNFGINKFKLKKEIENIKWKKICLWETKFKNYMVNFK